MIEESEPLQVSWNLSQMLLQEISELLYISSHAFVERRLSKAFESLKGVRMRIVQSLNQEERKQLSTIEEQARQRILIENSVGMPSNIYDGNRGKLAKIVEVYNDMIMDMLEKYGYLIAKKEDVKKVF